MAHRPLVLHVSVGSRPPADGHIPVHRGVSEINDEVRGEIPLNRYDIIARSEVSATGHPRTGDAEGGEGPIRTVPADPVRSPSGPAGRARSGRGRAPGTGRR